MKPNESASQERSLSPVSRRLFFKAMGGAVAAGMVAGACGGGGYGDYYDYGGYCNSSCQNYTTYGAYCNYFNYADQPFC
jgi:hypothetical protein